MSTIVTRAGKGSPLTHTEVDNNFTNLNTDKIQSGNTVAALTITSATVNGGSINGTTVGATTASTGAFTTLSATGVATVSAGTVSAPAITTTGDTNTGIFFPAADTIAFTEGGAEAMRLDASGNLGLGTSSPNARLSVRTTGAQVDVSSSATSVTFEAIDRSATTNPVDTLYYTRNGTFQWYNSSYTERMRITASGGISFGSSGTAYGTANQVLQSNGNAAPTWTSTITSPTLTTATTSGKFTFGGSIDETVYAVVDAAGVALSPANGTIQTWTLGASRTPTAGTWDAGESMTMMINDGTAYTITWTTLAVTWVGGSAPTLATTGSTVIELWKVNSTIYGALVGSVA